MAPAEVFDDLVELARLRAGRAPARDRLRHRSGDVAAGRARLLDPRRRAGRHLADVARRKLADFPQVEIVTSSFEEWDSGGERFDGVVSFNAFHWLDPGQFAKTASVLRPGGSLVVFGSGFVVHDEADPKWLELFEDEPPPSASSDGTSTACATGRTQFTEGGHFSAVTRRTYLRDLTYGADDYVALVGTMSAHLALEDDVREELFERMRRRIEEGGGSVTPTRLDVLYVATTA